MFGGGIAASGTQCTRSTRRSAFSRAVVAQGGTPRTPRWYRPGQAFSVLPLAISEPFQYNQILRVYLKSSLMLIVCSTGLTSCYRCTHTQSGKASSTARSAAASGASISQHRLSMWRRPSRRVPGGRLGTERGIMRHSSRGPTCGEASTPVGCASGKACTRRSTRLSTAYCTSLPW